VGNVYHTSAANAPVRDPSLLPSPSRPEYQQTVLAYAYFISVSFDNEFPATKLLWCRRKWNALRTKMTGLEPLGRVFRNATAFSTPTVSHRNRDVS